LLRRDYPSRNDIEAYGIHVRRPGWDWRERGEERATRVAAKSIDPERPAPSHGTTTTSATSEKR